MSYNLFLDDVREPMCLKDTRTWEVVRSYNEFVDKIKKDGLPRFISFDHDLANAQYPVRGEDFTLPIDYSKGRYGQNTGYHCAVWLTNFCKENKLPLPDWQVHSLNPVGRVNIAQLLGRYKETE